MAKKTFRISFPVVGTAYDSVDVDESELEGKSELEIKEILMNLASVPCVCNHCSKDVEELNPADSFMGEDLSNVSYWEEE